MDWADDRGERMAEIAVTRHDSDTASEHTDLIAVEEPLEVRVQTGQPGKRRMQSVSVTMRTPGHDFELAVGLLFSEGMLARRDQILGIAFCGPPPPGKVQSNIVRIDLHPEVELDQVKLKRNFYSTSSCGICGKASLDALDFEGYEALHDDGPIVSADLLRDLPSALRQAQDVFELTGGLHGAGLFTQDGSLVLCREDVGRHNAVDKLIGAQFLAGRTPLSGQILLVSGRVSFEILQKALSAGVAIIVAVGAPSSLAVEMAERFGMTLVGFARDARFNVYAGKGRIKHGKI